MEEGKILATSHYSNALLALRREEEEIATDVLLLDFFLVQVGHFEPPIMYFRAARGRMWRVLRPVLVRESCFAATTTI